MAECEEYQQKEQALLYVPQEAKQGQPAKPVGVMPVFQPQQGPMAIRPQQGPMVPMIGQGMAVQPQSLPFGGRQEVFMQTSVADMLQRLIMLERADTKTSFDKSRMKKGEDIIRTSMRGFDFMGEHNKSNEIRGLKKLYTGKGGLQETITLIEARRDELRAKFNETSARALVALLDRRDQLMAEINRSCSKRFVDLSPYTSTRTGRDSTPQRAGAGKKPRPTQPRTSADKKTSQRNSTPSGGAKSASARKDQQRRMSRSPGKKSPGKKSQPGKDQQRRRSGSPGKKPQPGNSAEKKPRKVYGTVDDTSGCKGSIVM